MFEATPKGRQIFRDCAVLANLGPAARAMKITAGADQQTKFAGKNRQAADLFGGLMPVDYLDCVAARSNIVANQLAALAAGEIVMPGMRQADPRARCPQGAYGVFQGRPVLLDVPQLAGAQPFAECFGAILYKTFTHHPVGKVRTGRGVAAVAQFLLDGTGAFQAVGHALEGQFAAYFFGPQPAAI